MTWSKTDLVKDVIKQTFFQVYTMFRVLLTLRLLMSYIYIYIYIYIEHLFLMFLDHTRHIYIEHLFLIFLDHTQDAAQSVGLLWTSDQLVSETST